MLTPASHTCPICGREAPRPVAMGPQATSNTEGPRPAGSPFPFCSPACKLVDLGRWLDDGYRIAGPSIGPTGSGHDGDDA